MLIKYRQGIVVITSLFFSVILLRAQDITSDFNQSHYIQIFHDFGVSWESNTSFKPIQWDNLKALKQCDTSQVQIHWMLEYLIFSSIGDIINPDKESYKLQGNAWFGTLLQYSDGDGVKFQDGSTTLYGYFHFRYNKYFRGWLYPRITTDRYSIPHYTGKPRPNRRAGFNTGETDMAGIGYFGSWIQAWFGRGRQNWGAMALDNLALSEKSAAYDHGTLQLNFTNLRLRYFHGYLETLTDNTHRYITGRGIEYNNRYNLIIGIHEIVIYSGVNRPIDIAYLNPVATHIEVELNERENHSAYLGSGNAIWQLALDWMPINGLRFSSNLLADEIVIDNFERKMGRPHALAYQFRLAWSDIFKQILYSVFIEYTQIGTNTLRHRQNGNNFVSRDLPLGTELGSDSDRWQIGTRIITPWRLISTFSFGMERSGEQNLLQNLYEPYHQFIVVPYPSGVVIESIFFRWEAGWYPRANIRINLLSQIVESNFGGNLNHFQLSLDVYLPTYFEI